MSITQQQWQHPIDAWQQTQLTQAQYCRSHQLDQSQFSYWKRNVLGASNTSSVFSQCTIASIHYRSSGNAAHHLNPFSDLAKWRIDWWCWRNECACRTQIIGEIKLMQPTLRPAQHLPTVDLYRDPIDFRKSHNGLSALIEMELGYSPCSGHLYAFINKQRNKIKCLFWEENGCVLYYTALAEEKFKCPERSDEVVTLTGQPLNWLLDGYDITLMKGHKKLEYESLFWRF